MLLHHAPHNYMWHCNNYVSVSPMPSLAYFSYWLDLAFWPSQVTESNPSQGLKGLHLNSNKK